MFCKKAGVLKNFEKFSGKHLCQSLFFHKIAGLRTQVFTSTQKLWHKCFPVNFMKLSRTLFHRTPPDDLLIPLKTSENQNFNDVFRGIKRENWGKKGQSKVLK